MTYYYDDADHVITIVFWLIILIIICVSITACVLWCPSCARVRCGGNASVHPEDQQSVGHNSRGRQLQQQGGYPEAQGQWAGQPPPYNQNPSSTSQNAPPSPPPNQNAPPPPNQTVPKPPNQNAPPHRASLKSQKSQKSLKEANTMWTANKAYN